jgi:hypothetical protein
VILAVQVQPIKVLQVVLEMQVLKAVAVVVLAQ